MMLSVAKINIKRRLWSLHPKVQLQCGGCGCVDTWHNRGGVCYAPVLYLLEALETGRNYANNFAAAR